MLHFLFSTHLTMYLSKTANLFYSYFSVSFSTQAESYNLQEMIQTENPCNELEKNVW